MGDELNALVVELNALVHELDNVESQSSRIWDDFPELQAKAQLYDLSGLGESGLTKVQLCAVDCFLKNEGALVAALNNFLEDYPFGPYDHLSEASREVQKLRKKGKGERADRLKTLLQRFAVSRGAEDDAFEQLPALMELVRAPHKFAHPIR
ncbi:hypothetical protein CHLRE_09g404700v5 [Chlamydomonas reinhardtii]|uniref:Uncharacterized protein n=1 Tax=Chlamydomonas reinhardtii TaxID=3055 RepID=A0A2K3DCK3_CHLRE|nr:uncharacterized protein CHLRE_09g404700v5 [Chlamydomonas reinhardtii]PNW78259.1 hypothetical protein CHLRE_09g404700v5 [Chlamydomonas reinhardtii]